MSLQFVLGNSGSGKTTFLLKDIIEQSIEKPEKRYFIVVPEQFTMQTQRDIVALHPNHGTFQIDIVSFPRLAYRIFEELNVTIGAVLEDLGKTMVIGKILKKEENNFKVLKGKENKPGFLDEVKSLLSELFQYNIKADALKEAAAQLSENSLLFMKLKDMEYLYEQLQEFLSQHYIVAEQILSVLSEKIAASNLLKHSVIYFDGFTGFTPLQYEIMEKLLGLTDCMKVSLTISKEAYEEKEIKEHELFKLSKTTIQKLTQLANKAHQEVLETIVFHEPEAMRYENSKELAHLEKNLFQFPFSVYKEECQDISIYQLQDMEEEVQFVGKQIAYYVREKGYAYKDIAIVTGDLSGYSHGLRRCLQQCRIPFFIDEKKSMLHHPCIESIRGMLGLIKKNFSYDSVFAYLKAGMSEIEAEEVDLLENYIIATGIRGISQYKKPFTRKPKTFTKAMLEQVNETRQQFMEEILSVVTSFSNKKLTILEKMTALYQWMKQLSYEERLEKRKAEFEEKGQFLEGKEEGQIFSMIIDLLEKIVEIMGEDVVPFEELESMLEAGFKDMELGFIPPTLDQVMVGDIERSRLNHIKLLFFVGVNDSIIPKAKTSSGLITDMEREWLKEHQVELAPTLRENCYIEQFYLYLNLTKPSEKLILTFAKLSGQGDSLRPSYLIGRLQRYFPKLQIKEGEAIYKIVTKKDYMEEFVKGCKSFLNGEVNDFFSALYELVMEDEESKQVMQAIMKGLDYSNEESVIGKAIASALYGKEIRGSVTRLEQYATCAFAHFLRYGLLLRQREEFQIASFDIGNILHKTLEIFSKDTKKKGLIWSQLSKEQQESYSETCVNQAILEYQELFGEDNARNQHMLRTMKRICKRTLWALGKQLEKGSFTPKEFELDFSKLSQFGSTRMVLEDESVMQLSGKIDRIDQYEDEDNVYLRIVDYKTGHTEFNIQDFYYGIQIQLIVYLNAALEYETAKEKEKAVIPAGFFYYTMEDPIVECGKEQSEEAILEALKMDGIVNSNPDIIYAMEKVMDGKCKSIPVTMKEEQVVQARSKVLETKQLTKMCEFVKEKMKELGNEMNQGNISIQPYKLEKRTGCDYCEYQSVCGFDKKLDFMNYRRLKKLSKEEAFAKIFEETNMEGKGDKDNEVDEGTGKRN